MYIFCYDISDEKTLYKVSKKLEKYGVRVQYSMFEVRISAKKANDLFVEISSIINPKTDRIFMYYLKEKERNIQRIGIKKGTAVI